MADRQFLAARAVAETRRRLAPPVLFPIRASDGRRPRLGRSHPRIDGNYRSAIYDLAMLVEQSLHPSWLSNAYLLADEPGGVAVFVDSGAPLEALLEVVERERLTPTHLLVTHGHADHVAGNDELARRFDLQIATGPVETGGLRIDALATPGHSDDGVSFVVGDLCFTGDTLFRDSVGGGPADEIRRSVMDVLMELPPETRVLPGHTDGTTIGREWERNPFIRYWRGLDPEDGRTCRVHGEEASMVVWSPDYDGKGKALVRLAGGDEAIIGASRIEF